VNAGFEPFSISEWLPGDLAVADINAQSNVYENGNECCDTLDFPDAIGILCAHHDANPLCDSESVVKRRADSEPDNIGQPNELWNRQFDRNDDRDRYPVSHADTVWHVEPQPAGDGVRDSDSKRHVNSEPGSDAEPSHHARRHELPGQLGVVHA